MRNVKGSETRSSTNIDLLEPSFVTTPVVVAQFTEIESAVASSNPKPPEKSTGHEAWTFCPKRRIESAGIGRLARAN
jgi:hypothetical protein